ncbi:MAG: bifunctional precorrin-2 dehydrogenase/sirohydrochlorin ferrochelatase [Anaerocolumna sp.]
MKQKGGYFPLFVNLNSKKIIIIGGGKIALRRLETLLSFSCQLIVIAPILSDKIVDYHAKGMIEVINREFLDCDIEDAYMVIAATNQANVNDHIHEICKENNILINHAGNKEKCDFYFPGIIKKEEMVIGVTASGKDHRLAKDLTDRIKGLVEMLTEGSEMKE